MSTTEKIVWGIFGLIVIALIGVGVVYRVQHPVAATQNTFRETIADPTNLAGLVTTEAPWNANNGSALGERMDAIGFSKQSMEGAAMHIHQQLSILVNGQSVQIAPSIGIARFFSPIHTHDSTGIIHVEAPFVAPFTLGQFFDVWGVRLTQNSIGGYVADAAHPLKLYVNGTEYTGDFRTLELKSKDVIAIVYGSEPAEIPSTYALPAGY